MVLTCAGCVRAGSSIQSRLLGAGVVAAAGAAYVAWQGIALEQALNGAIAAVMFNIVYDLLISKVPGVLRAALGAPGAPGGGVVGGLVGGRGELWLEARPAFM